MRADYPEKAGGDAVQIEAYARELEVRGWGVNLKPYRATMEFAAGEIVNLANVDRTYEFLDAYRQASAASARVFASPIHHDLIDTRRMRLKMDGSRAHRLLNTFLPEGAREAVVYLHRCVLPLRPARRVAAVVRLVQMATLRKTLVRAALDASECVFLLAPGEGEALRRDYGWSGVKSALTPNGIESSISNLPWADRPQGAIVCVGRIEPRKRQLELLRSADAAGVAITFIGGMGTEQAYAEAFKDAITASASDWTGPVSHDRVQDELQRARVLVNASWLEVQSLVDLEAAANGCYVVSSPAGYSDEWLGDAVLKVSDWSTDSLVHLARQAARRECGPEALSYVHTWSDTVGTLTLAYTQCTKVGGQE